MFSEELKSRLRNVHAFAVTPFKKDDLSQIDLQGLEHNLAYMIDHGVRVINVGGGTGEVEGLNAVELETIARVAIEVAGDRALILPTLPGNYQMALDLIPRYKKIGAEVLLAMAPFTRNQVPSDLNGVFNFYWAVGCATDLPFLPYNTQSWPADFFARLAEIDTIIGIKDPCLVPHNLFLAIQQLGERFVWIGNKRHSPGVLHLRYQMGIEGFTAGNVNFAPAFELSLHETALQKDWNRMVELQAKLAPLERLRTAFGDTVIKAGLDLVGLSGGPVRPPRVDLSAEKREELKREILALGLATLGAH